MVTTRFFFSSRRRHTSWSVTGVQTCALPISPAAPSVRGRPDPQGALAQTELREALGDAIARLPEREKIVITLYYRSEERRVGKEGGGRGRAETLYSAAGIGADCSSHSLLCLW